MSARAFSRVLDSVLTFGALGYDQRELARLSQSSDATVSKARRPLHGHGPLLLAAPVRFSPELGLVLGLSLGSESARAGLVDANGTVHCEQSAPPKRNQLDLPPADLLERVRGQAILALEEAFTRADLVREDGTLPLLAAAMALPAPLDREHRLPDGGLRHADWNANGASRTLNEHLAATLGAPFTPNTAQVMNDCNAAAIAVAFERVRERESPRQDTKSKRRERTTALVVRVSGRVGAGMIEIAGDPPDDQRHVSRFLKSRVMVGTNGLAGEIGHIPVSPHAVDVLNAGSSGFDGLRDIDFEMTCSCGGPHHLQALAGWNQLARRIGLQDDGTTSLTDLLDPFLHPRPGETDRNAARALEDAGKLIGRVLTGTVLTLDPHSLTVLGSLSVSHLIDGLIHARSEWQNAFWTGRTVSFDAPLHGSKCMSLRGAGLALLRAQRHRKLRQIGAGNWRDLAPLLPYGREHLARLSAA